MTYNEKVFAPAGQLRSVTLGLSLIFVAPVGLVTNRDSIPQFIFQYRKLNPGNAIKK